MSGDQVEQDQRMLLEEQLRTKEKSVKPYQIAQTKDKPRKSHPDARDLFVELNKGTRLYRYQ